jgi:metal transporter CNNM
MLSTVLLLIFGEILPQAICTKYGLLIGGHFIWLVRLSLMLLYPVAYPTARLLEWMLGRAHGVVYKRAELKELVSIMGGRIELAPDEVKIIRGVLELRDKHPALIMTPLAQVYMLDAEGVLDRKWVEEIVGRGYSRVPIFLGARDNIIGMVLVKRLLALNLNDPIPISQLPISPVPHVSTEMSLFSILNDFQQGRSHLAIVTLDQKQLGILTMEDIIEEMIQEEIVDESDLQSGWQLGPTSPTIVDLLAASRRRVLT